MKIDVLDKGHIELVDTLGDDLTPVNAARVSFGGRSDEFTTKDKRLSKFLIKHKHFSPFRHQHIMVIVKAPEFVLRQWYKHVVGIETTSSSVTSNKSTLLETDEGKRLRSLSTSHILSAPKDIPTPETSFKPKMLVNSSYLPPPTILPMLESVNFTSIIDPV